MRSVALLPRKHPESLQPFIRDPIIVCALSESRHAVFYERDHGQASRLRHMLHLESPHRNPTRDLRNEWLENNRRRSLCLPSEGRCKAEPDLRNSLIAEAEARRLLRQCRERNTRSLRQKRRKR